MKGKRDSDGREKDMIPLIKLGNGLNCKMVVDRHLELVPVSLTALPSCTSVRCCESVTVIY